MLSAFFFFSKLDLRAKHIYLPQTNCFKMTVRGLSEVLGKVLKRLPFFPLNSLRITFLIDESLSTFLPLHQQCRQTN